MSYVELRGVRKTFDQTEVIRNLDLSIMKGELVVAFPEPRPSGGVSCGRILRE